MAGSLAAHGFLDVATKKVKLSEAQEGRKNAKLKHQAIVPSNKPRVFGKTAPGTTAYYVKSPEAPLSSSEPPPSSVGITPASSMNLFNWSFQIFFQTSGNP
ncbi:hypothetical protein NDU88_002836 [Pleurodeles waltl]|uniref:Uncharacterized protein n=1 Tax=Pleurodeles waltl TaxID=8319 RepID=A0AAV7T312_PLEWA|nr:hypothetical protein NDU88_002836 [Pleurodeles waltl]